MAGGQNDLTQGSVTRQLVKYALPVILSNLLQAAYSMADIIIAGRFIGNAGISAINNSSQIMMMLTQVIMGISMGGNILISQYFGVHDEEGRRKASNTVFTLSLIGGAALIALMYFAARPVLSALGAPALEEAAAYLRICSLGVLPIFGYNALSAAVRGVGNSRQPLYFVAVTAGMNIFLDILLVGVLGYGVRGAAVATVVSQYTCFLTALIYVMKNEDTYLLSMRRLGISGSLLIRELKLGVPCAVQMTVAGLSWLAVTYFINKYGVDVSAGNGVSIKIKDFCQLFITAMASSSVTMIAQNIGAAKFDRARSVMYSAMRIALAIAVFMIILVQLLAPQLVSIFTGEQAVADAAVRNLRIEIFGQVFYAVFLVYHSLALGAGHTLFVLGSSFTNCILVRLPLAAILNHYMGVDGVYLACLIAPASSVPLGIIYQRSGIWRRRLVAEQKDK